MEKPLAEFRRNAGFRTQEDLAEIIGVKRNSVARWEAGERCPRPRMIQKLANILKTTEGEIIYAITSTKDKSVKS